MDNELSFPMTVESYFQVLDAARSLTEGTLRRLLDLHNRYPRDLPAKTLEQLLVDEQSSQEGTHPRLEEEEFPLG
ncbi:MAG TPA: hypothetical protein VEL76_24500 [Gemmataceae bacterium]|nr:hypothetical protein [Gemmataceae bacterium]